MKLPTRWFTHLMLPLMLASSAAHAAHVEYLTSPEHEAQGLPFSEAVRVDDLIILSGQIGVLPGGTELAPGGIEGETHQVMANIRGVLERHGAGLEDIVKCTAMLADMAEWPAFNGVYASYFPGPKPARSAFGASGLGFDARLELECWAVVRD